MLFVCAKSWYAVHIQGMEDALQGRLGSSFSALLLRLADAAVVFGALWLVVALYDDTTWSPLYLIAALIACLLFLAVAERTGTYVRSPATGPIPPILNAWAITVAALAALAWMTKTTGAYSRVAVGLWCMATPLALVGWRFAAGRLMDMQQRRAGIFGNDPHDSQLGELASAKPLQGQEIVGFYAADATTEPAASHGHANGTPSPIPVRGGIDQLVEDTRSNALDVVYITLPMSEEATIEALLDRLADTTVSVYLLPDMLIRSLLYSRWVQIGPVPAVNIFESPHIGLAGALKRAEDLLLGAAILLVATLPMLLIGAAIKAFSPGPILFRQRRYGIDGREFLVWKFRTMTVAQDGDHIPQAQPEDARITPIGAFLRHTSLDELPQLFNVLRGEMSLVGPRPHAVAHNEEYRRLIPGYMRRHKVKPGMTGWAQINGWRGPTDTLDKMAGRLQYDLWYLRRWSIWLDLEILLKTPWVVWVKPSAKAL